MSSTFFTEDAIAERAGITVYGNVSPRPVQRTAIDCRTCTRAGMSGCTLYAGQCSNGSAYQAAPVLRFWRDA